MRVRMASPGRLLTFLLCVMLHTDLLKSTSEDLPSFQRIQQAAPSLITRKEVLEEVQLVWDSKDLLANSTEPYRILSRMMPYLSVSWSSRLMNDALDSLFQDSEMEPLYTSAKTLYLAYNFLFQDTSPQRLPETLLCIAQARQDCTSSHLLARTLSTQVEQSLLDVLESIKSPPCWGTGRSFTTGAQYLLDQAGSLRDTMVSLLALLPSRLLIVWRALDMYIADLLSALISAPVDFAINQLQMLIDVPNLDQSEKCPQGNLKQLLLWGLQNNLTWNFDDVILIPYGCMYLGLECPSFRFMDLPLSDTPKNCDQFNFTAFNSTICSRLLELKDNSSLLSSLCSILNSLTLQQASQLAIKGCTKIATISSSFLEMLSSYMDSCPSFSRSVRSVPVEHHNISDLDCTYSNWTQANIVDPAAVFFCSENDSPQFAQDVCSNEELLTILLQNSDNMWLEAYCANYTEEGTQLVSNWLCRYSTWVAGFNDPTLVAFCWENDRVQFEKALCEDLQLFLSIMANAENSWLFPNCTEYEPPTADTLQNLKQWCNYSKWQDPEVIDESIVTFCAFHDTNFTNLICSNFSILEALLKNQYNSWLPNICTLPTPTEVPVISVPPDLCSYSQWMDMEVDSSIITLCWQLNLISFKMNVCCNVELLDRITQDQSNSWLLSACQGINRNSTENETQNVVSAMCQYHTWVNLKSVDMTDVAACSEFDPDNFIENVCFNHSVLQGLLSISENTWLIEYCSKADKFRPQEMCQYHTWVNLKSVDMTDMAACSEFDPDNFIENVCFNQSVLQGLLSISENTWLIEYCSKADKFRPQEMCQYHTWVNFKSVDMTDMAACSEFDPDNFIENVCFNQSVLQGLLSISENTWLIEYCSKADKFRPQEMCQYHTWVNFKSVDMTDVAACSEFDPDNFIENVCFNQSVVQGLLRDVPVSYLGQLKIC
ncbi:uncharacterized protein LOC127526107 [Erpetoichthys calabaricus]|uniref:uncharacterized protein LOC127526107 n=1 Tax=Erpetoichthys calabaricus TaxID=27687 RepID=UPI002234DEE5|nr:uncharacterized protein LOC127526107 [Erpetoichthys calabaricus]